jgi:pyruvate/2-oxoglutarate dehydrogenase complex dihydrolipoamide acyltransferase (E2) component
MHGLLEVDVTEARRLLGDHQPPLSMTAFVIAAVARAVATHPEVHAYRDWRGRLVRHRHVDVQTLVEVATAQGPFGLVHVVRDADVRGVADISAELRGVQADMSSLVDEGAVAVEEQGPRGVRGEGGTDGENLPGT